MEQRETIFEMSETNQRNKAIAQAYWAICDTTPVADLTSSLSRHIGPDFQFQGFDPVGTLSGAAAFVDHYLLPLRTAFPDLVRQTHIAIGGLSDGKADGSTDGAFWVGATGYLCGRQAEDVWGVPARNQHLRLRWGEFLQFDTDGRILRSQTLIDVIDWLEQGGLSPLPRSRGAPFVYPAPTGAIGTLWDDHGARAQRADDQASDLLAFGRQFIFGGLNAFDQSNLKTMKMADYFHPNLKWYGPGGIGACLSLTEFEELHQRPWLDAFPDRKVGDLDNLIAEGAYLGASSLPGVYLTQTGPYLGHTASHQRAGVNGIDFWRYEKGQFTENWVFVDMLHLFKQFGVDLMARVQHMTH